MSENLQNSRRDFLKKGAAAAVGSFFIVPRHVLGKGFIAPSDKLNIAAIGAGGKGQSDIINAYNNGASNVVALCDVDWARAKTAIEKFPNAKKFRDFRVMLDQMKSDIDAVTISTPDHFHAYAAMACMQMGKHVYVQKPLTHNIAEARMLTKAARKYKVVTQMGNQGASGDGVRMLQDWYNAGLIGDVHTIYCYTDRPVWPQGVVRPTTASAIPAGLDYDLWLGTAPQKDYFDGVLPFNWRGWWDYGTGALGDMACHIMAPGFAVLGLGYPVSAECSVATRYTAPWQRVYSPDSPPAASHIILTFKGQNGKPDVKLHWMDGGIQPERPAELGPNEVMGDGGNGIIFEGTKGKMMAGTYGMNPQLLPTNLTKTTVVPKSVDRVKGDVEGHYAAWVEACIAGPGSKEAKVLSSNFDIAGPLTESVLMGNLAIRSYDVKANDAKGLTSYPGRNIQLMWDGPNMKITNFDLANQFVKRTYRDGWNLGV